MKTDTMDFLSTLLWLAADNEDETGRALTHKTIHDFSPAFVAGAEAFINAFRAYLEATGRGHLADAVTRSFGGNVYLSLSGHGAGFFDESDADVAALHDVLKTWSGSVGNTLRFEELDSMLDVGENGKIDLSITPEFIDTVRGCLFKVPEPESTPVKSAWYVSATANKAGQVAIASENDGRTIALVYNENDAALLAAAPSLLAALKDCAESLKRLTDAPGAYRVTCLQQAVAAISSAEGK